MNDHVLFVKLSFALGQDFHGSAPCFVGRRIMPITPRRATLGALRGRICDDSATTPLNQFAGTLQQRFGDVCRHNLTLNEKA
jgi:hypothetical protein